MNRVKDLVKNGKTEETKEFLNSNPEWARTAMWIAINCTDNTVMADVILEYYQPTYVHEEVVERYLDVPDKHIDFKIDEVAPKMKEWLESHRETFLRPFTIIRRSRNHDYVIRVDKYNFQ